MALIKAIRGGHADCVRLLLDAGADKDIVDLGYVRTDPQAVCGGGSLVIFRISISRRPCRFCLIVVGDILCAWMAWARTPIVCCRRKIHRL